MKKDEDILVSISCITYNHEKYIRDALEGFLMQKTDFKYEILIHDDASTDNTAKIIREYEEKYPDLIKPIYQKENQWSKGNYRISSTFNIPRAKGKYIAFCEGDDFWTDPYKLQKQVNFLEENEEFSMSIHAAKRITPDKKFLNSYLGPYGSGNKIFDIRDIGKYFFATASKVVRKEVIDKLPQWANIGEAGDFPMELIIFSKGKVYYFDEIMSAYRVMVPGSSNERLKKRNNKEKIKYYDERIEILKNFNKYTNKKFEDPVKEYIYKLNILKHTYILNPFKRIIFLFKSFKQKEFKNKKIIKKIKIIVRVLFPKISSYIYFKIFKRIKYEPIKK
jgi:glycosyltransferase involved in cell wall biosynthesis